MKKLLLSFILLSTISFTGFSQCTITSPASLDVTAGNFLYGQTFTATCGGFLNYVQFMIITPLFCCRKHLRFDAGRLSDVQRFLYFDHQKC